MIRWLNCGCEFTSCGNATEERVINRGAEVQNIECAGSTIEHLGLMDDLYTYPQTEAVSSLSVICI